MKQLFVVHTQYNLILAIGIAQRGIDELILFQDFDITKELRLKIKKLFGRCLFLSGSYPKRDLTAKEKLEKISKDNRKIDQFINVQYDRIFIVEDMCIQEMYSMKCVYRKNRDIEMAWLEDGANAYFSNSHISKGMGSTPLRRLIRKLFFTVRYSLYGFYNLGPCMGSHFRLRSVYVCFPDYVRKELQEKEHVEITNEQLIRGMQIMYQNDPSIIDEGSLLIAMDLLSVYGDDIYRVNTEIAKIVSKANEEGKKVYCKYHPRETEKLPALSKAECLDSRIAIESYLINTTAKHLTVVGCKSTAIQVAKKMGYQVISFVRLVDKDYENILVFYRGIGIECT